MTVSQAAHIAHDARALKSLAEETLEDGVHAARRAIKSVKRGVEEFGDEAVHQVKRQPLTAVGFAAGFGLVCGVALGVMGTRCALRQSRG